MNIVFRADSSPQIGTGHIMRCLTLANQLKFKGYRCTFVCRELPEYLSDLILRQCHSLVLLPRSKTVFVQPRNSAYDAYAHWLGVPWYEDVVQTKEVISALKPDWLVVDHYALDSKWESQFSTCVGNIMVIDDLANRPHECNLLLDQNLGRTKFDYENFLPHSCKRLIGPKFAVLRPEFPALREKSLERRKNPELKRILISMGGVDRANVTGQVLEAIAKSSLLSSTTLDIVLGPAAPHLKQICQWVTRMRVEATVGVGVSNMSERMSLADVSIGASGGTSWERCCLGVPSLVVALEKNQVLSAAALESAGAALNIVDAQSIQRALCVLSCDLRQADRLARMSKAAARITDGFGVGRVVEAMGRASR